MKDLPRYMIFLLIPSAYCWLAEWHISEYKRPALLFFVSQPFLGKKAGSKLSPTSHGFKKVGKEENEVQRKISLRDMTGSSELRAVPTTGLFAGSENQRGTILIEEVKSIDGVDVFIKLEDLGGNRRRISGGLFIEAPPKAIWDVLTNYSSLSDYIPNIAESGSQLQANGKIRIEQVGVISQTLNIKTKIVLEVTEEPYRKLTFSKIESREFLEFEGTYSIIESPDGRTYLEYSVEALPLPILPIFLVQNKILQEVPPMLAAVRTYGMRFHQQQVNNAKLRRQQAVGLRHTPAAGADERRISRTGGGGRTSQPPPLAAHSLPSAARNAGGGWAQAWLGSQRSRGGLTSSSQPRASASSLPFASMASSVLEAAISMRKFLPGIKTLPGDREE